MTRKISTFVIMAFLASSLAFAGEKSKTASSEDAKANADRAATTDNRQQDGNSSRPSMKDHKTNKHNSKPVPLDRERQFEQIVPGLYGRFILG